jgi:hypothetical protein
MDGSKAFWMTLPFWEVFQMRKVLMDLVDFGIHEIAWSVFIQIRRE